MLSSFVRAVPFAAVCGASLVAWYAVVPVATLARLTGSRLLRSVVAWAQILWSEAMLALLGIKVSSERVPTAAASGGVGATAEKGLIYVYNHTSLADPWASSVASGGAFGARFLFKREICWFPPLYVPLALLGHIPVDRSAPPGSRGHVIERCVRCVLRGESVALAPEGTRKRAKKVGKEVAAVAEEDLLLPFKQGAFRVSCATGQPVVPLVLLGLGDLWPTSRLLPRPGFAVLRRLPPVAPSPEDTPETLSARVREMMMAELRRPMPKQQQQLSLMSTLLLHLPALSVWALAAISMAHWW